MKLAIEIGGTKLQLFIADETGVITRRIRHAIDPAQGAAGVLALIAHTLGGLPTLPTAIGVGFGGPVDAATGRIITSHQVAGWTNFDLAAWLHQRIGVATIRVENDANVAALGEARHGAGRSYRHVFYITLGSGVGGGMVIDGQLYRGNFPGEAEVGHVWVKPPNPAGQGGQTLEQACSGWAVNQLIHDQLASLPPTSTLRQLVEQADSQPDKVPTAQFLGPALAQHDPAAEQILAQVSHKLALGLSHVVHLFHPDIIVLGGGLSLIGEPLRQAVERALSPLLVAAFRPGPAIQLAQLGPDAVPIGALALLV